MGILPQLPARAVLFKPLRHVGLTSPASARRLHRVAALVRYDYGLPVANGQKKTLSRGQSDAGTTCFPEVAGLPPLFTVGKSPPCSLDARHLFGGTATTV